MATVDLDLNALVGLATGIAEEAGALLLARIDDVHTVDEKSSPVDAVTEVDREAEALIVERILAARPGDGVIGEEGASRPGTSGLRWLIDPIDGTVNYLYRRGGFCVSLGVEDDAGAVVGVVRDPSRGETFWAVRGGGAFLVMDRVGQMKTPSPQPSPTRGEGAEGTGGNTHMDHDRAGERNPSPQLSPARGEGAESDPQADDRGRRVVRLEASGEAELSRVLLGTGFGYEERIRREQAPIVAALLPQVRDIRRQGSAALDLCAVAAGRLDGYFERGLNAWDVSAGALIAREAGAVVERLEPPEAPWATWMAAAPGVFEALRAAVVAASNGA